MTIAEFLLARIAEDEAAAGAPPLLRPDGDGAIWDTGAYAAALYQPEQARQHALRWSPLRVLAECDAKRRIVEDCKDYLLHDGSGLSGELARRTLWHLAQPYADHPDYDPEWRP